MNSKNDYEVTSEILSCFEKDEKSNPQLNEKNVVSRVTFTLPSPDGEVGRSPATKDEDGDYIVRRKGKEKVIYLEHSVSTNLNLVGLQIWRAALLLADFIIHFNEIFKNQTVLELGSGVGLTSIIAGMFARQVICTDLDVGGILNLIKSNVERNKDLVKAQINVLGLDFFNLEWSSELRKKLEEVDIVLAADVIYDNDVTEAFVKTITNILSLSPKKTLYLALEKRYVFTISDLDTVAPCYEHLMACIKSAQSNPPFCNWNLSEISLDFPQYFKYEKVRHLVMYKITT